MTTLLPQLGWECDTAILEDPPNYFRWRKGAKTLRLLDSTNYWKVKLADMGERIGLSKLTMPENWQDREVADTYCKRDVTILLESLTRWIEWLRLHDLGGLGISIAQQSYKAYKHRFLNHPIFIDANDDALELARDGYYGGRVECWTLNQRVTDIHCCDVNSMYTTVMEREEYPTKLHGVYSKVTHDELARWLDRYCVMARVTLEATAPMYPERTPETLVFPTGVFQTVLASPELRVALQRKEIRSIQSAAIYDRAPIFREWCQEMYPLKQSYAEKGDRLGEKFSKDILNSLYGKFGQRGSHEEIVGRCDPTELFVCTEIDLETGTRYRIRHIAGLILARSQSGESRYSHPAIAAHVTAHARCLLWTLAQVAGISDVHYMDTDSLHTTVAGYQRLRPYIDPTRLGYLKLEKVCRSGIYYGPKDYELDGVRKIKGVSASAVQTDVSTFSQSQWVSMKGACLLDHSGGPLVRRITKKYSRRYRKGTPTPTGRVLPLVRELLSALGIVDSDR